MSENAGCAECGRVVPCPIHPMTASAPDYRAMALAKCHEVEGQQMRVLEESHRLTGQYIARHFTPLSLGDARARGVWAVVPPSYDSTGSMDFTNIRTTERAAWEAASSGSAHPPAEWVRYLYCEEGWRAVELVITPTPGAPTDAR